MRKHFDAVLNPVFHFEKTSRYACLAINSALLAQHDNRMCHVHLDLVCPYTASIVRAALLRRPWCVITNSFEDIEKKPLPQDRQLQLGDFENIEWPAVLSGRHIASSYLVRKGLSRKAQLSIQIRRFIAKNKDSILATAVPTTIVIETWDAFDDMQINFGFGAIATFNAMQVNKSTRQRLEFCLHEVKDSICSEDYDGWTWILKPSVTNKGMDISVVSSWDEILDCLENTTDIREWVLQRYIPKPLLVQNGHKFHLRVYILCLGAISVYVYDGILMLIAAHKFDMNNTKDVYAHLTNTARSVEDMAFDERKFVQLLDDLPFHLLTYYSHIVKSLDEAKSLLGKIRKQINLITSELFQAFENEYTIFCPMSNCFEVYGLDFMVDENFDAHLLEVNPGPDFKQTGGRLRGVIVNLWEEVSRLVIDQEMGTVSQSESTEGQMTLVYHKEWSASKLNGGGMSISINS
jgi:tubulin---tyrosine ligase